jgi:hypothetical protein
LGLLQQYLLYHYLHRADRVFYGLTIIHFKRLFSAISIAKLII